MSGGQKRVQKPQPEPLSACHGSYDDVFELPLRGEMAGHEEADKVAACVRIRCLGRCCFRHQNKPLHALALKGLPILLLRPVSGSGTLPLQIPERENVIGASWADRHEAFGIEVGIFKLEASS